MTVKIGLISDIHATPGPLREALAVFAQQGVATILCAGDIAGYGPDLDQTVQLLTESGCQTIVGNHDLWRLDHSAVESESSADFYLRNLPLKAEFSIAGKKIYMVHASPPESLLEGIKLLDEKGSLIESQKRIWIDNLKNFPYDLLLVGHTHQLFAEWLGGVLVVNPGSTVFNHTCVILHLPEMRVEIVPLSGKKPLLSWNWGMIAAPNNFNSEE